MAERSSGSERQEEAKREAEKRLREKPQPPDIFNPLSASDERLQEFGIMPRPRGNPVLLDLWERALSPSQQIWALRFEDLRFDARYRIAGSRAAFASDVGVMGSAPSRFGSSRNWSGAYVVANRYRRFTAAAAIWNIPRPKLPVAAGALVDDCYQAVTWVGLDGNFRRSRSLPQAGTTQSVEVIDGAAAEPTYAVWFQWWVRNQRYPPIKFDPLKYPVAQGDEIICILLVDSTSDAAFIPIANVKQFWTAPVRYWGLTRLASSWRGLRQNGLWSDPRTWSSRTTSILSPTMDESNFRIV